MWLACSRFLPCTLTGRERRFSETQARLLRRQFTSTRPHRPASGRPRDVSKEPGSRSHCRFRPACCACALGILNGGQWDRLAVPRPLAKFSGDEAMKAVSRKSASEIVVLSFAGW